MVVSGLVVKTMPEKLKAVKAFLANIREVSITRIMDQNKVLVIIDCEKKGDDTEITDQIRNIDGVIGVSLAYHHFESQDV